MEKYFYAAILVFEYSGMRDCLVIEWPGPPSPGTITSFQRMAGLVVVGLEQGSQAFARVFISHYG